jgi:hypothetical protein
MKSNTSPTPSGVMNRVTKMAVSGKYSWRTTTSSPSAAIRNRPPPSACSSDPNTLGESNRGQQNQSTLPSVVTSAAVCRSPISPCSAIGG